ncbi:redoxin domain-containing protein [Virgibacillus soli]|uniref:Redoxin domain-containing protein n=1 Tax=Paracerasibacillus soli TaxID=480284 RepID=A0ABU5CPR2_9BACI|nr:redoxin domain-containing protein [Virgibacillus soli]MDY0408343.1 redoxin domain-containing protein [Virgibacillus soli]
MSLEQRKASKKNKKQRRLIFRSVILAIMLGAIVYALVANFNKDKSIYDVGDEAPDFELKQINENNDLETIRLSDFRGKGVMLNLGNILQTL